MAHFNPVRLGGVTTRMAPLVGRVKARKRDRDVWAKSRICENEVLRYCGWCVPLAPTMNVQSIIMLKTGNKTA
jgi:hypothetical protein